MSDITLCWDEFANRVLPRCCDHKVGGWGINNVLGDGLPRKVWFCRSCYKKFAEPPEGARTDE